MEKFNVPNHLFRFIRRAIICQYGMLYKRGQEPDFSVEDVLKFNRDCYLSWLNKNYNVTLQEFEENTLWK